MNVAHPANNDAYLAKQTRLYGKGLRNATHRVDLAQPPFNMDPLEGRARYVPRPNPASGGRLEAQFELAGSAGMPQLLC